MPSSHPLPPPGQWFSALGRLLDRRSGPRLAWLLVGAVLARGRRTVTSWIRAAGLSDEFRPCYTTVSAAGKRADAIAARLAHEVVRPLVADAPRLTFAIDDTPPERYGRFVQGAGVHHNPCPGPAGGPFVFGHVWVVLGLLAAHPSWGVTALPLLARLYVRAKDLPGIAPKHRPAFRTKLEMAADLMRWAVTRLGHLGGCVWVVADGAYAKAAFLKPMRSLGVSVVNVGAFHMCLWTFTATEAWAWGRAEAGLVGHRSASPWDDKPRRPSHADKRRAWRRELLENEIRAALRPGVTEGEIAAVAERLLRLAA
ncbi:MAG: transposase [Gemmataceae bacterium]